MIDLDFWRKVSENWCTKDDGIDVPDVGLVKEIDITEDEVVDPSIDSEIADILADLDI